MPTTEITTTKKNEARMPRASVSFPSELHDMLERIAKEKKVSVAWVVREAAEQYVANQWPLLGTAGNSGQHHD